MEDPTSITSSDHAFVHHSALVQPLQIMKMPSRTRSNRSIRSQLTRHSSSKTQRTGSIRSHTPPLTPRISQEMVAENRQSQAAFHNYLRAFYHFHPETTVSSSTDESSITVPIEQGDIILVHSVHPNGWADGTILASGARGWLPTNYCEAYDHEAIRNLLNALTSLWDLVRCSGEQDNVDILCRQDCVRGMIAGVRFFLDRTQCLSREASLVQCHIGLRRMRKGLLSDLSALVKISKNLQVSLSERDVIDSTVSQLLDEMVLKAFKVVTRAVRFLDIWDQDVPTSTISYEVSTAQRPPTPPSEPTESITSSGADVSENEVVDDAVSPREAEPIDHLQPPQQTIEFSPLSPRSETLAVLTSHPEQTPTPTLPRARSRSRPLPLVTNRSSVTHRLSYIDTVAGPQRQNLASDKLSGAHDVFLGYIGSFIGSHLQSRSSEELLDTTTESVKAGRELLKIVAEVWERDSQQSESLQDARDMMFLRLAELVQATKDILTPSATALSEEVFVPDQGQLVSAATNCVRAAGDCVTKARLVIEKTGDFEFEQTVLGIADSILEATGAGVEAGASSPSPAANVENVEIIRKEEEESVKSEKPLPPTPSSEYNESILSPIPEISRESKPLPGLPEPSPTTFLDVEDEDSTDAGSIRETRRPSRPNLPALSISITTDPVTFLAPDSARSTESSRSTFYGKLSATDSMSPSLYGTMHSNRSSVRGSMASIVSHPSTRPTTPDGSPATYQRDSTLLSSFGSVSELQSTASEDCREIEEQILGKTYAHELVYNKEGQVVGGSLAALVEKLTTHDSTPDSTFVTAFYLTFRLFTTPVELAQCLIDRFDYIGEGQEVGAPVRLRVYNIFKGWLESHWQGDPDDQALGLIFSFATDKLRPVLPTAGKRLAELTSRVTELNIGTLFPRSTSSIGKSNSSLALFPNHDSQYPNPIITRSQLSALQKSRHGGTSCSILDFDPLELARQFTLIEARIFCAIQPEELLGSEWTKKNTRATNVRAMSTLSTDLANLVADTILGLEEPKKRALSIKQWVKIAMRCLELNNYDSLMAIVCSLNSSMVLRLKRTWELVSQKTLNRFNDLKAIVDVSKNYAVLRQRLQNQVAPCIPFVGIYLTDLTFVDVGNSSTRTLPSDGSANGSEVINFDKHMKTAKIIGQLQRFQVPYKLAPISEMQEWMEAQIKRVRVKEGGDIQGYYRRSLFLEPREAPQPPRAVVEPPTPIVPPVQRDSGNKEKIWSSFSFGSTNSSKERLSG